MSERKDALVKLEHVRINYPQLAEPRAFDENSKPQYSAVFSFPKSDLTTTNLLQSGIQQAISEFWGDNVPTHYKVPVLDGDKDADLDKNPELENCWYFRASSSYPVEIYDRKLIPYVTADAIRELITPGCYGDVVLSFKAYDYEERHGVKIFLQGFLKTENGARLGNDAVLEMFKAKAGE